MANENQNLSQFGDVNNDTQDELDIFDDDFDRQDNDKNQKNQQSNQQNQTSKEKPEQPSEAPSEPQEPGFGEDASKPKGEPGSPETPSEPGFGQDASKIGKKTGKDAEQLGKKGAEDVGKKGAEQAGKKATEEAGKKAAKQVGKKAATQGGTKLLGLIGGSALWWAVAIVAIVVIIVIVVIVVVMIFATLAYSLPKDNDCVPGSGTGEIYVLGDSIGEGLRDSGNLKGKLEDNFWTPTINALQSSHISIDASGVKSGLTRATEDKDRVETADVIVIELGTNDTGTSENTFRSYLNDLYIKLQSFNNGARFYWVNYYGESGDIRTKLNNSSRYLEEFVKDKRAGTVIDWASQVRAGDYVGAGSFHPTATGYQHMANVISSNVGEYSGGSGGGVRGSRVPCIYQTDPKWANVQWGTHGTMASSACGLTSMAMAISAWQNKIITPPELAQKIGDGLHRADQCHTNGLDWSCIAQIPTLYGLPKAVSLGHNFAKAKTYLQRGVPVISSYAGCPSCVWTDGGHFILLTGMTNDGKVIVNDPYDPSKATGRTGPWCNKAVPVSWVDGTRDPVGSGFYAIVGREGQVISGTSSDSNVCPTSTDGDSAGGAEKVIQMAKSQLRVPYVYGGCHVNYKDYPPPDGCQKDSNYDCSGFTGWAWYWGTEGKVNFGGAGATDQCLSDKVDRKLTNGKTIAPGAQPGDLICFGNSSYSHHIAIYLGNNRMIAAPHTGDVVKIQNVYSGAWAFARPKGY